MFDKNAGLKRSFRLDIKRRITALENDYIRSSDMAVYKNFLALPELSGAVRVLMYYGIGREVSTEAIINRLMELGKTVALPVCEDNGIMHFAELTRGAMKVRGMYGIPEPPDGAEWIVPEPGDIIAVPALAYDIAGYRMGKGKGYYDRYLGSNPALISVGLARGRLVCNTVPRSAHDARVNILVTEDGVTRFE